MQDGARHKENIQRVQVGLTGIAGIVLMIGMVNLIVNNVRDDRAAVSGAPMNAVANESTAQEPLAELGVAPAADPQEAVVPDLQPDPKLHQPMDRVPVSPAPPH